MNHSMKVLLDSLFNAMHACSYLPVSHVVISRCRADAFYLFFGRRSFAVVGASPMVE